MQSLAAKSAVTTPAAAHDKPQDTPLQPNGADAIDSAQQIARMEAELAKNIEDYNKRPKKTQITTSTREVGYAMYYKALQDRIEKIGTLNFPQQNGRKLYGELVLYIPIYQDGSIYHKEGGPRVERSSGNPALDQAALRIVAPRGAVRAFPAQHALGRQGRRLGSHHALQLHAGRGAESGITRWVIDGSRTLRGDRPAGRAQQIARDPCALRGADRAATGVRAPGGAAGRLRADRA